VYNIQYTHYSAPDLLYCFTTGTIIFILTLDVKNEDLAI